MTRTGFGQLVDDDILRRAGNGCRDSQTRIYRTFERPAYTLAVRMLSDSAQALDVLQDAMISAFTSLGQYRADAPFGAWLKQIVVREALMRLRSKRTHDEKIAQLPSRSTTEEAPGAAMDLANALAQLPDTTRAVVWLYDAEGYSHEEIAAMWKQSVSFSKSRLSRGRAQLRAWFDESTEATQRRIEA